MIEKQSLSMEEYISVGVSLKRKDFTQIEDSRGNVNRSKFISNILREYFIKTKNYSLNSKNKNNGLPVDESFDASNQQVKRIESG